MLAFFVVIVAILSSQVSAHVTCSQCSLYNLTEDPNEEYNLLITQDDDGRYEIAVDEFEDRIKYWTQFFATPTVTEVNKDDWKREKGVRPWNTSDFVPLTVETKYHYSEAPNIIFVLVDDWGWNNLGSRSTFMPFVSPTIDSLMDEGVSFSNYYSNELCAPSRASLMTGRYAFRLGFQNATSENGLHSELDLNEVTMGQEMQSAGYKTYIIGKWVR
jgi:hypothetical protein